MSFVKWDTTRRSYILFTGPLKRAFAVQYIINKIKSTIENSEACETCKFSLPLDAIHQDTFFLYVTIDCKDKKNIKACDSHIFSQLFRELERLGIRHRVTPLSFPEGRLRIAYINVEG